MFKIEDSTIKVTRGDVGIICVTAKKDSKTNYTFQVGDVVRLKVFKNKDCGCVELQKDLVLEKTTQEVEIELTGADTKIGELVNKPTTYWYEIELNPDTNPQTIVGYDDKTGAKLFIVYPEGGDKT